MPMRLLRQHQEKGQHAMGSAGHLKRAHIVVLDDDREMGAWLVDLLTDEGYIA